MTQYKEPKYHLKNTPCTIYAWGKTLGFDTISLIQELPSASGCSTVLLTSSASVLALQTSPAAVCLCSKRQRKLSSQQVIRRILGPRCSRGFSPDPSAPDFCAPCAFLSSRYSQFLKEPSAESECPQSLHLLPRALLPRWVWKMVGTEDAAAQCKLSPTSAKS